MEVIKILSALLTPVIALLALYIAYQQYHINKINLKKELYDKRLRIYQRINQYLINIIANGTVKREEIYSFYNDTIEVTFLFKNDIISIRDELYNKSLEFNKYNRMINGEIKVDEETRKKAIDKDGEIFQWFNEQFDRVKNLFSKYLSVTIN